jgi:hypothetical protein
MHALLAALTAALFLRAGPDLAVLSPPPARAAAATAARGETESSEGDDGPSGVDFCPVLVGD